MVKIEEDIRENESGEEEKIIRCMSQSKRIDYASEWLVDSETRRIQLVEGKKKLAAGDHPIQIAPKTVLEEHRTFVKEYLREKDESDEDNEPESDEEDEDDGDEDDEDKEE